MPQRRKIRSFLARSDSGAHKAILFADDGSALPTASIVQYAFPDSARERVSYSGDNRQRGFLPLACRNRCVLLRRTHSARRSTYQFVLWSLILHKGCVQNRSGQSGTTESLSRSPVAVPVTTCNLQALSWCPGLCTKVPGRSLHPAS